MRIGLFNANSYSGKKDLINEFIQHHELDLFNITETHLGANPKMHLPPHAFNITRPDHRIMPNGTRMPGSGRPQGGLMGITRHPNHPTTVPLLMDEEGNYAIIQIMHIVLAVGYFPPTEAFTSKMSTFLDKARQVAMDRPLIVMGDLNARSRSLSNDRVDNRRGRVLRSYIEDQEGGSQLQVETPIQGKWTSFGPNGGSGVTDIVLSSGIEISNMTVWEQTSLGGSDHRPITFEINLQLPAPRQFSRWNIRKFIDDDVRDDYAAILHQTKSAAMQSLHSASSINSKWEVVKDFIEHAATTSIGKFNYRGKPNANFVTEEIQELRRRADVAQMAMVDAVNLAPEIRSAAARRAGEVNAELRAAIKERKRAVYMEHVENISHPQNSCSFLRIVKGFKSRSEGGGCALDPTKMSEHTEHFARTFGQQPRTEPEVMVQDRVETDEEIRDVINPATVAQVLKWAPCGKAAGPDGLMGEFYRYGDEPLVEVMVELFHQCYTQRRTPEEWKEARIVPIFKNKGSPHHASNYRPIALTCVARRLYERVLMSKLEDAITRLSPYQGGFRSFRNTQQQCFALHEIMQGKAEFHNAFLDIQAAYDTVNRNILWRRLEEAGIDGPTIIRLQDLFDNNESILTISNHQSSAIQNLRGLLQGSSLSPILFNFFIDSLSRGLMEERTVRTHHAFKSNHLLFADDANIHATSIQDLRQLLRRCEQWARDNDIQFAPQKCIYIGPALEEEMGLEIEGLSIIKQDTATYLGIQYHSKGIDWQANVLERTEKARKAIPFFQSLGFNNRGWPPAAGIRIYKAFIRPLMEYGMALAILPPKLVELCQKVQNKAIRTLLGAANNTSTNALHRLLYLEPMEVRNRLLNGGFGGTLHNLQHGDIPAVVLWRMGMTAARRWSLVTLVMRKNPIWGKIEKENHLSLPLISVVEREGRTRQGDLDTLKNKPRTALTIELRRQTIRDALSRLGGGVASSIELQPDVKPLHCLRPGVYDSWQTQNVILRWRIGGVCCHQMCHRCEQPLSRDHGLQCSGVIETLNNHPDAAEATAEFPSQLIIDALFNYRRTSATKPWYTNMAASILQVYKTCLNMEPNEQGFLKSMNAEEARQPFAHSNVNPHHSAPITGHQSANPTRTLARRINTAINGRNHRRGRTPGSRNAISQRHQPYARPSSAPARFMQQFSSTERQQDQEGIG